MTSGSLSCDLFVLHLIHDNLFILYNEGQVLIQSLFSFIFMISAVEKINISMKMNVSVQQAVWGVVPQEVKNMI